MKDTETPWLQNMFFLSGMAALAYQICWQRILFFSFGTDIESTTIIVSAFMLGLGLGALAGGWAADRWPEKIVPLFAVLEFSIGVFGFASPYLLPWASGAFVMAGRGEMAAVNFALILPPACCMGATLPMLVAHALKAKRGIGVETGDLYCVNTLGGAFGCGVAAFLGFHVITLKGVINAAACINLFVAASVFWRLRRRA